MSEAPPAGLAIYKVQVETGPGTDEWINANVTGDEVEARRDYEWRSQSTRGIQRVRLKRDHDVVAMSDGSRIRRTVTLVGSVEEHRGRNQKDGHAICGMDVPRPYPHVVYFSVRSRDGRSVLPAVGRMEEAEEVQVTCDVLDEAPGFDAYEGYLPALETDMDRIVITRGPAKD
jgi:hypothetical protein